MEAYTPFDRIFQSCGKIWHFRRADMDKLWEGMTEQEGREDRLPYWNEIWPSSLALAGWLAEMQEDIQGKNCLDMGCGIGFTAVVDNPCDIRIGFDIVDIGRLAPVACCGRKRRL